MRAVVLTEFGGTPTVTEIDVPEPAEDEVRVRVHGASVNGFDLAVANSYLKDMMEHRFPVVLGKDFSGTVDKIGTGVSDYAPGDRVFGVVTKPYLGDGSFAEFVTVPVSVGLTRLPESVELTEAAGLGLAGSAALAAVDAARPQAGQLILVAGATGGVGNQCVQLAAKAGAHVIATAHTEAERNLVTQLGAAEVVDYTGDMAAQVLAAHPDGVDTVLHFAGDPAALLPVVRSAGRFVSTIVGSPEQLPSETVTVVSIRANPDRATLDRLAEHQADQHTRVTIQQVYRLDQAPAALADFAAGTLGKLVITTE